MQPSVAVPLTDAQLIACTDRNADSFAELYDRHFDGVLGFFYRRTACPHLAADLTAETFADAFSSRRRFRDTGAPGASWLYKIARRQLSHYLRREEVATRARRRMDVDTESRLNDADVERIENSGDLDLVRKALEELPANQAEAVWLRVGRDLSYTEVALQLSCSEAAARVRVSRGLTRLTDALQGATS